MIRMLSLVLVLIGAGLFLIAQEGDERAPYSIKVDPVTDINPVKTQHTIVATVLDQQGNPLKNQRVEWILARGPNAVGDIVEHDDMNTIVGSDQKVVKLGNQYTVTYTNDHDVLLDMGTPDPRDDIKLGVGQTWITITSPLEGETNFIAFCPNIKNANQHKTFGIKYWMDADIIWPEDAINKVNTPHTFQFKLYKASNDTPLPGYRVKWQLLENDVPGYLNEENTKEVETQTNESGEASVVLNQVAAKEGINTVRIELRKPTGELLAIRNVTKTWIAPRVIVQKTGPAQGIITEDVIYNIEVSNPGAAEANDVVLKDTLPDGMSYRECSIAPSNVEGKVLTWNLGNLAKDASKRLVLKVRADQTGLWKNVASVTSQENPTPQESAVTTDVGAPEIFLKKEGVELVRKDNMVRYTVTIKNNGNAVAKDLVIEDIIPAGMQFRTQSGAKLTWRVSALPPGETKAFAYDLLANQTGTFINTAKVFMQKREVHKTEFTTRVIAPDLKVTKDGSSRVILNKPADYTITVTNNGDADAKDMVLVDILPQELEFVSAEPMPTMFKPANMQELATATWKLGTIAPKQTISIKLKARANTIARCRNTVKLRSDSEELPRIQPLEAFFDTNIHGVPAMHINTYDTEDPVEIGKQTIYVVETRNEGTSPCSEVVMISHLDDEFEFVRAEGPTPFRVEGNDIIFEAVPVLQPAEKLTYKVTGRAIKPGSAKHKATLKYKEFDKPIMSEEGTNVYQAD